MNLADALNLGCLCRTLRPARLAVDTAERPHLFSASPFFITHHDHRQITQAVAALDRVAALPGFVGQALARAPAVASHPSAATGVFMGYDFHLSDDGPRLIEINTNAGGAFLHAQALQAHQACCRPFDTLAADRAPLAALETSFFSMFEQEWASQAHGRPWHTVAIVDENPAQQYLAPEFERARALFEQQGLQAVITDPAELQWRDGRLWHPALPADRPVDLVYNRLTDFQLATPASAALQAAWLADAVVLTPHPRAHAVHADKRNLITLGDADALRAWGASPADVALLQQVVPHTQPVTPDSAAALWAARRGLFFKPAAGYGSRAAYRGDKLTRRVWDEIVAGDFVAQALVPPTERAVRVDGEARRLKVDVRAYAFRGQVLLLAARTYQGQTTNFRTPGGGFAPIVVLPDSATACNCIP